VNLSSFDFLNSSMGAGHTRLRLQPKLTTGDFMSRLSHSGIGVLLAPYRTGSINTSACRDEERTRQTPSADVELTTAAAPVLGSIGRGHVPFESAPKSSAI
jgi:hypothetical protein